ncbi:MAG: hypothetical protein ABIW76_18405 [Fibrobacteria bacterium]
MLDRKSLLGFLLGLSAQASPAIAMGAATSMPTLKTDTAIYHMEPGTLQYAFTFTNPTDSVVFLDCQIPPYAHLAGGVLTLTFDRGAFPTAATAPAAPEVPAAADSVASVASASGASGASPSVVGGGGPEVPTTGSGRAPVPARSPQGVMAGGPVDGGAVNPNDFPPQRVAAHQTFRGQRRLDRVLGDWNARPVFAKVQLRMAVLPERDEGDGAPYVLERARRVEAAPKNVVRNGKPPMARKVKRIPVP